MIRKSSNWIFAFVISNAVIFTLTVAASAEGRLVNDSLRSSLRAGYDQSQCSTMIEECMRSAPQNREICLYDTSHHLFCSDGQLGKLAEKRSLLVSSPSIGQEAANPKVADQACLEKFDNHLSARLIRGGLDKESIDELLNALSQCVKPTAPELLHP